MPGLNAVGVYTKFLTPSALTTIVYSALCRYTPFRFRKIAVTDLQKNYTMQIVRLILDHINFFCPATGERITGGGLSANDEARSLVGYWIDCLFDEPHFNAIKIIMIILVMLILNNFSSNLTGQTGWFLRSQPLEYLKIPHLLQPGL